MDGIKFQTKFDIRYSLVRRLVERRRIQKNVAYDTEDATVAATLMRALEEAVPRVRGTQTANKALWWLLARSAEAQWTVMNNCLLPRLL